jgi:hypothetical protein
MMASDVAVRRARLTDAERTAELAGQLGYPTPAKEMKVRLKEVFKDKDAACFVADVRESGVAGWIHVSTTPLLEVGRRAEVNGLVVDEMARSWGDAAGGGGEVGAREAVQEHVGAVECAAGAGARILFAEWIRALQDAEGVLEGFVRGECTNCRAGEPESQTWNCAWRRR